MIDICVMLLCAIFMAPVATLLAAGVFWLYVKVKESVDKTAEEYVKAVKCGFYEKGNKNVKRIKNKK